MRDLYTPVKHRVSPISWVEYGLPAVRILAVLLLLLLTARVLTAQDVTGVFVVNQGDFSSGTGSVTVYNPVIQQTTTVLDGLATIYQSATLYDGRLFVTANSAGRIEVLDTGTRTRVGQTTDLISPRYLVAASATKAYVTNLYGAAGSFTGGVVTVMNPTTYTKGTDIPVGDNPEGLALVGARLYVANHGFGSGTTLSVIDTTTDTVVGTINLGCDGPRLLFADAQTELHVVCTGNTLYDENFNVIGTTNGQIVTLDGPTGTVVNRIELTTQLGSTGPGHDVFYAPDAEEAYVIVNDTRAIYRFDTVQHTLVDTLQMTGTDGLGAVAYDDASQRLYVGRVTGFATDGYVTVHDRTGTEITRFDAGTAPTYIAFQHTDTQAATSPTDEELPTYAALHPAYPNPFNPATTLPFDLTQPGPVRLSIVNALGQTVATLVDAPLGAGSHSARWEATDQPSGVYLARLQTGTSVTTQRLVLVK